MSNLPVRDVLIVDDDEPIRGLLCAALNRRNLTCDMASDGSEALVMIERTRYSVILVDLMMPRLDGADFIAKLVELEQRSTERSVVLLMTAFPESERVGLAGERVQAVIQKPFDLATVTELAAGCVQTARISVSRSVMEPVPEDEKGGSVQAAANPVAPPEAD